ncbi:DNA ligase-1 [Pseudobacteriovorax antillogorgiicola]|uniref:DNA ligase (ATP) n=1 Tax=Pseudobacteriovorax antillogorgiicola TaxID=1513793 RepID=A0A1Y6C332_9BACT|nr:DNA ligase-1 [Pseudobacteriovorax antillogorgiicola]SMF43076.1 DNA ligase-1 [Pseudobacteriovorax antillogorgiicola]
MREWLQEINDIPGWLLEESYGVVGDIAETIALLLPDNETDREFAKLNLEGVITTLIEPMQDLNEQQRRERLLHLWRSFDRQEVFLINKFITGGFRVGVSKKLVTRAVASAFKLEPSAVAHRLMGPWAVTGDFVARLRNASHDVRDHLAQPYPFCLAHPIEVDPEALGSIENYSAEWKWDGIRCQLIKRQGQTFLWSRGEELINDQFPDLLELAQDLPNGTVLDGELLVWDIRANLPAPFHQLQKRLGRKKPSPKIQGELPVRLVAYDLIEWQGDDIRSKPLRFRREILEDLMKGQSSILLSERHECRSWGELKKTWQVSRDKLAEGLMLKLWDSRYHHGRKKGDWWKWKVEPLTLDVVMIYAEGGHGRRANLCTSYTFAVWRGQELVPIAKAYTGLNQVEIVELDRWIKRHTEQKFGPVRQVEPVQVFELAFEGISPSGRHKSKIALRFPRILRWRKDKSAPEADTLSRAQDLLNTYGGRRA